MPEIPAEAVPEIAAAPGGLRRRPRAGWRLVAGVGAAAALSLLLLGGVAVGVRRWRDARAPEIVYEQLTDLTDAAVAPAISPDGRTLAYIRGGESFASTGPIYAKSLPRGEDRPLSNDPRPKYGLAFSPDGSQIAYTVFEAKAISTYAVSIFGGEPRLLRTNAAGLSWLSEDELLYSEIRTGIHLGVVTGAAHGGLTRDVYFPAHQRGMAHYSEASPDRRWVLVVEMDSSGGWAPCRVVPFEGGGEARTVGPPDGACTAAAWSSDGRWMYFTATVAGQSHLWRQRFPDGEPQQISSGAAEEEGLAVERTGGSVITSVGTTASALWIHDGRGERPLTTAGEVLNGSSPPLFRKDDSVLFFLLRRGAAERGAELWRAEPSTGRVEAVVPGREMLDYDVSQDGERIVFSEAAAEGGTELWVAPTDHSRAPARIGIRGARFPRFAAGGRILFQAMEGPWNYLEETDAAGQGRSKLVSFPISELQSVSPDGRWVLAFVPQAPGDSGLAVLAIAIDGSVAPVRLCSTYCLPRWASSGRFLFVRIGAPSPTGPAQEVVLPVGQKSGLPTLPPRGLPGLTGQDGAKPRARAELVLGTDPTRYAFVQRTVRRNLFRVRLK